MADQSSLRAMDSDYLKQDVGCCLLCEINLPQFNCESCQIKLCKTCVGQHFLQCSTIHTVAVIDHQNYPKCKKQVSKQCNQDVNFGCSECLSPDQHDNVRSGKLDTKINLGESPQKDPKDVDRHYSDQNDIKKKYLQNVRNYYMAIGSALATIYYFCYYYFFKMYLSCSVLKKS